MTDAGPAVELHAVTGEELRAVERTLARSDLPTADVRDGDAEFFIASADGRRVGVGGIEQYGTDGLLRSVAVDPTERGRGVGTALCDALEARAAAAGVERLFLLTTTAPGFFADRGYAVVDRADVPETIGTTAQFADLCPDAATVMSTSL